MKRREVRATLEAMRRLELTRNGNPRYLLQFDCFTMQTKPDASVGYAVSTCLIGKTFDVFTQGKYIIDMVEVSDA